MPSPYGTLGYCLHSHRLPSEAFTYRRFAAGSVVVLIADSSSYAHPRNDKEREFVQTARQPDYCEPGGTSSSSFLTIFLIIDFILHSLFLSIEDIKSFVMNNNHDFVISSFIEMGINDKLAKYFALQIIKFNGLFFYFSLNFTDLKHYNFV